MSQSSGHGTSSGDLNTKCKLSDSSILDVFCGLEVGHADHARRLFLSWSFKSHRLHRFSLIFDLCGMRFRRSDHKKYWTYQECGY